jgi:hypothetical protein
VIIEPYIMIIIGTYFGGIASFGYLACLQLTGDNVPVTTEIKYTYYAHGERRYYAKTWAIILVTGITWPLWISAVMVGELAVKIIRGLSYEH